MRGNKANDLSAWHLKRAAALLRQGAVIAYPTEAVWGLGCDPLNGDAVTRLLEIKHRPMHKGLILIAAAFDQLQPYVAPMDASMHDNVFATWPGPVTWLLPARPDTPHWLRGAHETLAVRVTAHPVAAALCKRFGGALVSTSANLAGRPPARTYLQALRRVGLAVDYIAPGAVGTRACPTEIRDASSGAIVRPG